MKKWEKALDTFLLDWKDRKEVIGILLTGSYANGTQTKFSDIDVHLVLSEKTPWRERGNKYVDGYLIEYFANSIKQHEKYNNNDLADGTRGNIRMFATGKILLDKTGELTRFKEKCKRLMSRPFKKVRKSWVELHKYELWDSLDTLHDLADRKAYTFSHVYGMVLQNLMNTYCRYKGLEPFPPYKWDRLLASEKYCKKYRFNSLPASFVVLFLAASKAKGIGSQVGAAEKLTEYVHHQMGGFSIDGWACRTKPDK